MNDLSNMTIFFIVNAIVWTALLVYVSPSVWAMIKGYEVRRYDPTRLAIAGTSLMMAGFAYRWLLVPDSEFLWQVLYGLSSAVCVYQFLLIRAFGRGDEL